MTARVGDILLLAVFAGCLALCLREWRCLREAGAALAASEIERREAAETQKRLSVAGNRQQFPAPLEGGTANHPRPSPKVPSLPPSRPTPPSAAIFLKEPTAHALYLKAYNENLAVRYHNLFSILKLSPNESRSVCAVLARTRAELTDLHASSSEFGGPAPVETAKKMEAEIQAREESELKSLLGDSGYKLLSDYREMESEQRQVAQLQPYLLDLGDPLTPAQAHGIASILYESHGLSPERVGGATVFLEPSRYASVREKAASVLSPRQMEAFDLLLESRRAHNILSSYAAQDTKNRIDTAPKSEMSPRSLNEGGSSR